MIAEWSRDSVLIRGLCRAGIFSLPYVGTITMGMAEVKFHSSWYFIARQFGWAMLSFLILLWFKRMDYRRLNQPVWAFAPLGIVLGLMALVFIIDPKVHRWLRIGSASLQPSEFAKPALIIFLAYFLSLRSRAINDRHTLGPA